MSQPAAPYATPAYTLPTAVTQAAWSEDRLQQECLFWLARQHSAAYALCFAIPNGGLRGQAEANKFKATGVKAGVPDLLVAMPRYYCDPEEGHALWYGLFVELKTATGRVAPEQAAWHLRLRAQGYRVEIIRSLPQFIELLTEYLA